MRRVGEIRAAEEEMFDRVWYDRNHMHHDGLTSEQIVACMERYEALEKKYGKESLQPMSDFDWGMLNGKVSALRWVLGDEWDNLDT